MSDYLGGPDTVSPVGVSRDGSDQVVLSEVVLHTDKVEPASLFHGVHGILLVHLGEDRLLLVEWPAALDLDFRVRVVVRPTGEAHRSLRERGKQPLHEQVLDLGCVRERKVDLAEVKLEGLNGTRGVSDQRQARRASSGRRRTTEHGSVAIEVATGY